jgi:hypothetical protein
VTDASIAPAAEACGERSATFDRDFSKLLPGRHLKLLSLTP